MLAALIASVRCQIETEVSWAKANNLAQNRRWRDVMITLAGLSSWAGIRERGNSVMTSVLQALLARVRSMHAFMAASLRSSVGLEPRDGDFASPADVPVLRAHHASLQNLLPGVRQGAQASLNPCRGAHSRRVSGIAYNRRRVSNPAQHCESEYGRLTKAASQEDVQARALPLGSAATRTGEPRCFGRFSWF